MRYFVEQFCRVDGGEMIYVIERLELFPRFLVSQVCFDERDVLLLAECLKSVVGFPECKIISYPWVTSLRARW